jgi:hypothetical protein
MTEMIADDMPVCDAGRPFASEKLSLAVSVDAPPLCFAAASMEAGYVVAPDESKKVKSKSAKSRSTKHHNAEKDGMVDSDALSDALLQVAADRSSAGDAASEKSQEDEEHHAWRKFVIDSWNELKRVEKGDKTDDTEDSFEAETRAAAAASKATSKATGSDEKAQKGKSMFGFLKRGSAAEKGKKEDGKETGKNAANKSNQLQIPQSFEEMCILNASMLSVNLEFVKIMQSSFDRLMGAVSKKDDVRLELEANLISLRIHKEVKETEPIKIASFKMVMLASLRSLLPKSWSIEHDQAWTFFWELLSGMISEYQALPAKYEKAAVNLMSNMADAEHKEWGVGAFNRLFETQPGAEFFFKSSNARLNILAGKGLELAVEMYRDPMLTLNQTTSLGLRHVMYNVSIDFFEPFVHAIVEELKSRTPESEWLGVEGVEYTLTLIATIMVNTINDGANPLLRAVIANSAKDVRKALQPLARKDRAEACL